MEIEECLRKNKLKITKGRVCILDILLESNNAMSADEILKLCKEKGMDIDLSTVYRTLELMESKKILEKFDMGSGRYNFIIRKEDHKHILKCTVCKKEVEFDCPMQQVEEYIKTKTGFIPTEHELKIEGICEECNCKKHHNKT